MSSYDEKPFDPAKAPDPQFVVPDLMQAVEGWRAWSVARELPKFGVPPKLSSPAWGNYYWIPRKVSVAECERCEGDVPGESCSCGFYSAKTLEHLQTMPYNWYHEDEPWKVVGQVANWGKVIEGSLGWRAQKSYPVRLYVPFEAKYLVKPLSEAYGVPVRLKNHLRREPLQEAI